MWLLLHVLTASPPSRPTHAALGELGSAGCMPSILASCHSAPAQHAHLIVKGKALTSKVWTPAVLGSKLSLLLWHMNSACSKCVLLWIVLQYHLVTTCAYITDASCPLLLSPRVLGNCPPGSTIVMEIP
jgi:hypothetical protein